MQIGDGRTKRVLTLRHGGEARVDRHVKERPARGYRAVELNAVVGILVACLERAQWVSLHFDHHLSSPRAPISSLSWSGLSMAFTGTSITLAVVAVSATEAANAAA
mmetsp:Transcript_14378/g.37846  ORF Transcript_14378/g.37846 Transcript_14378/m.37846 type:complete len:106 (-) Transcript_14378:40-357(-)